MVDCSNSSFIILAGGKSSRYGSNKYELFYGKKTFLQVLVEKSRSLSFGETIISGLTPEQVPSSILKNDLLFCKDIFPDRGPLGGLHACFQKAAFPTAFVITVDCPSIPAHLIESVVKEHTTNSFDATLLKRGDSIEPLIGMYNCCFYKNIEPLIQDTSAPVFRALDTISYMSFPHNFQVQNINTKSDYDQLAKPNL